MQSARHAHANTCEDKTNHATREGGAALRPIYKRFPRSQHAASARPPMPTRRAVASRPHAARLRGPPRANARNRAAYGNIPPTWPGDPPWFQSEKRLHNMPNAKHPPGASVAASALASDSTEPPSSDTVKRPFDQAPPWPSDPWSSAPWSSASLVKHSSSSALAQLPEGTPTPETPAPANSPCRSGAGCLRTCL